MLLDSPYRPHNPGHDYYAPGTYLITLVVCDRAPLLGTLGADPYHPSISLSPLGTEVAREWERTAEIQRAKGRHICLLGQAVMPDHWHGVIQVEKPMDCHLGEIIRGFKMACTQAKRRLLCLQPCMVANSTSESLPGDVEWHGKKLRNLSPQQRAAYLETLPAEVHPLFDANYDDSIALRPGQEDAMIRYVLDNPRRAILRKVYPELFARRQHLRIGSHDFAAFGNLFLLKWGWKEQVMCHRWRMIGDSRDYHTPYEATAEYATQRDELLSQAMHGAVLVTPGISKGEQLIKGECLSRHLPLIHLQKEPIGPYWKPESSRFDACLSGMLLILAPWQLDDLGTATRTCADGTTIDIPADSDYSRFHNMNKLAEEICRTQVDTVIKNNPVAAIDGCDLP